MARRCVLAVVIAAFACTPAHAALTHSWHADGNTDDAVGTADGVANNGATFAPGLSGQGFSLDGIDDTVTFGDAGDLGTADFSIAFAIKTTFPGDEVVLTKRPICDFSSFFDIHEGAGGTLSLEMDGGNSTNHAGIGSLDRVDDGVLHTAVATRQGQVVTWFIDGVPSGSNDLGSPQNVDNAADLILGSSPCVGADGVSTTLTGVVDELRIADTADPNLLPPPVPVNLSAPAIPTAATEGDALTCQPGDWRYHPAFTFQWLRDGQPIDGATGSDYTATAADVGHSLSCRVKGSNAGGDATADSNAVRPSAKPVTTTPPTNTPPTTTPPVTTPPPIVTVAPAAVGLPSAKRCVSGRRFAIHLRKVRGEKVASATVFVKGRRVKAVKGKQITAAIDLRGLPKGKFVVRIVVTTVSGKRFSGKRTYRTCSGRRKGGKHPFAAAT